MLKGIDIFSHLTYYHIAQNFGGGKFLADLLQNFTLQNFLYQLNEVYIKTRNLLRVILFVTMQTQIFKRQK